MSGRIRRWAAAATAAASLTLGLSACGPFGGDEIEIVAHFTDSVGLFPGNDVDVLGVPVGSVKTVTPKGTSVEVRMSVPADLKVPADAGALIIPPTVITDRYVELTPVWTKGPVMADGGVIPLERTRTPVEFDRIIRSLNGLATSLNGDAKTIGAIQDALGVAAKNLDGNGKRINRSIKGLSAAVGALSENREDLSGLFKALDGLTANFARNDDTVRRFSNNVTKATGILADNGDRLDETITALAAALTDVGDFVKKNQGGARESIQALTAVLKVVNAHRTELTEGLDVLPLTLQNLARAVDPKLNRIRSNASAAANILNPVVAQQICDGFGPFVCPQAGKPIGSLGRSYGEGRNR